MKKSFLLLVLFLGFHTAWGHDAEIDGIFYNLTSWNKTATVTFKGEKYNTFTNEYAGDVVIPESITVGGTTYSVTSLGYSCFRGCSAMTSISIPNTVTSLDTFCFYNCTGLPSITVPSSVTSLGSSCFRNCNNVTSITIPESVTSWGDYCLAYCSSLTSISIPQTVTNLGTYCFGFCTGLSSITIPSSVTNVGYACFEGCSALTSLIMLPTTPPSAGDKIFYNTPMETVYVVDEDAKTRYQAKTPWNAYEVVVMEAGIDDLKLEKDAPAVVGCYDLSGKKLSGKPRGIVVKRYADGSSRKVMVK